MAWRLPAVPRGLRPPSPHGSDTCDAPAPSPSSDNQRGARAESRRETEGRSERFARRPRDSRPYPLGRLTSACSDLAERWLDRLTSGVYPPSKGTVLSDGTAPGQVQLDTQFRKETP